MSTTPAPVLARPPGVLGYPSYALTHEIEVSGATVGVGGDCAISVPVLVQEAGRYTGVGVMFESRTLA